MSTIQKSQDTLRKYSTQEYFRTKVMQYGAHQPDGFICKFDNTTEYGQLYTT